MQRPNLSIGQHKIRDAAHPGWLGQGCLILAVAFFSAHPSHAEELDATFKKVSEFAAALNYSKAIEELSLARKELERLHLERLKAFFPDSLVGMTGAVFEAKTARDTLSIERKYASNDGASVKLSLSGSNGAGAIGDMAPLGRLASMLAKQPGQEGLRINGRTAQLVESANNKSAELTVYLNSGMLLKLEGSKLKTPAILKDMANAIKLEELEKYLKG